MIHAERILQETYPDFKLGEHKKLVIKAPKKLIHEDNFNDVIRKIRIYEALPFSKSCVLISNSMTRSITIRTIYPMRPLAACLQSKLSYQVFQRQYSRLIE